MDFLRAVRQGGITATRTTFVANLRQTFRSDRKTEKFVTHRLQHFRQLTAIKVFRNQRIVGSLDTELHSQVQTRRRLAGTAHTHQNHIGFIQALVHLAVIVSERVVDGFYTTVITFLVSDHVATTHGVSGLHADFLFEFLNEGAEQVDTESRALLRERLVDFLIDERRENHRADTGGFMNFIDAFSNGLGLFDRVDERDTMLVVFEVGELS